MTRRYYCMSLFHSVFLHIPLSEITERCYERGKEAEGEGSVIFDLSRVLRMVGVAT